MKTASISQTRNQLSGLIDEVKRGGTVLILDRGRPVARLVPAVARPEDGASDGRLERLERTGAMRRAERPLRPALLRQAPPEAPGAFTALEALLAERRDAR